MGGVRLKVMHLRMYALLILLVIVLGIAAPLASTLAVAQTTTTPTNKGVDALVMVLRNAVERAQALFTRWNVPSDADVWEKLEEINNTIANVTSLVEEGKIDEARSLAIKLLREIAELVKDAAKEYGERVVNVTKEREHIVELRVKIRVLNNTISILLNLTVRVEKINATLAEELRKTLEEARAKLEEAVKALNESNISLAEELVDEVEDMVSEVKETINHVVSEEVKEEVHERIEKAIERIEKVIDMLEEKVEELMEKNLTAAAEQLKKAIARLQEVLEKLKNMTAEQLNITISPEMLAKIFMFTMREVHVVRDEVEHHEEHYKRVVEIEPYVKGLIGLVDGLMRALQQMSEHMRILPEDAKQIVENITLKLNELKTTIEELVNASQTGNETLVDDAKEKIEELVSNVTELIDELKDKLGSKPMFMPILTLLARIKESLDHIPDYLEKVVEKAKEISEEAKTRKMKKVLEDLEDVKEKIEDLVKMVRKMERRHHVNASEVRTRLKEMLKLVEQVKVQLKNNNTSEAIKLMLQLKQLVNETEKVCTKLRLGKEITVELAKTGLMLEILIKALESSS